MIEIALWLIPIIGIPAVLTLTALNPAWLALAVPVLLRIVRSVVGFFRWVLSYRVGCAFVAAIVAALLADHWRHSTDDAAFAKRTAEFEQAQVERDQRIEKHTETLVRKQIADDWMAQQGAKEDVQEFKDRLPPDDAFRVGADADKLRGLAGETVSGPSRGVPPTTRKGATADHHVGNGLSSTGRRSPVRAPNRQPATRRQGKV